MAFSKNIGCNAQYELNGFAVTDHRHPTIFAQANITRGVVAALVMVSLFVGYALLDRWDRQKFLGQTVLSNSLKPVVRPSVCPYVRPSVCPFVCQSVRPFLCPFVRLFVSSSVRLSVRPRKKPPYV